MIKVENLTKNFKGVDVLKGITTEIRKGDVLCVIGPSGSGKSTFLRCLNLLEEPSGGKIVFDGENLTDKKTDLNKHRQKMGMVFQQFNLFPHMTVLDNLTCAPVSRRKPRPWSFWSEWVLPTVPSPTPTSSPADRSSVWPSSALCAWSRK